MKEVYFYLSLYRRDDGLTEIWDDVIYYSSFEEAEEHWSRDKDAFTPIMKGYVKE